MTARPPRRCQSPFGRLKAGAPPIRPFDATCFESDAPLAQEPNPMVANNAAPSFDAALVSRKRRIITFAASAK